LTGLSTADYDEDGYLDGIKVHRTFQPQPSKPQLADISELSAFQESAVPISSTSKIVKCLGCQSKLMRFFRHSHWSKDNAAPTTPRGPPPKLMAKYHD